MDLGGGLYQKANGTVISKHDSELASRRNSRKLESVRKCGCGLIIVRLTIAVALPASQSLMTGGSGARIHKHTRIGNQAFNSLKRFLDKQHTKGQSRGGRVSASEFATKNGVLDDKTRLLLFKVRRCAVLGWWS